MQDNHNKADQIPPIHLTFAVPNHLDSLVASHILKNSPIYSKDNQTCSTILRNDIIFPILHGNTTIADVAEKMCPNKNIIDSKQEQKSLNIGETK